MLTRAPKGFPEEHPAIDLLKNRQWGLSSRLPVERALKATLVKDVVTETLAGNLTEIRMSQRVLDAVLALRSFLFEAVYENTVATAEFRKATDILSGLWEKVRDRPDEFLDRRDVGFTSKAESSISSSSAEGGPTIGLQASSTCTRQVAQVQEPPHSATILVTSLRSAVSITVEPISASTVCLVPSCSM